MLSGDKVHSHSTQRPESLQAGKKRQVKFRRLLTPRSLGDSIGNFI